jgi:hypothetical protein
MGKGGGVPHFTDDVITQYHTITLTKARKIHRRMNDVVQLYAVVNL